MLTEIFSPTVGTKEETEALSCSNRKSNFNLVLKCSVAYWILSHNKKCICRMFTKTIIVIVRPVMIIIIISDLH